MEQINTLKPNVNVLRLLKDYEYYLDNVSQDEIYRLNEVMLDIELAISSKKRKQHYKMEYEKSKKTMERRLAC